MRLTILLNDEQTAELKVIAEEQRKTLYAVVKERVLAGIKAGKAKPGRKSAKNKLEDNTNA